MGGSLAVLSEEFLDRIRKGMAARKSGTFSSGSSHWLRPHQTRWTRRVDSPRHRVYGWKGGLDAGCPEFDWSVILAFDGEHWKRVDKFLAEAKGASSRSPNPVAHVTNKQPFMLRGQPRTATRLTASGKHRRAWRALPHR